MALSRPRVHHEALDWARRVVTNGGSVSQSTLRAVSTFCDAIDSNGLRSLLWRVSPMAGGNLSACLVPLYRGPSFTGTQYGSTTDANNGPFVSGDYTESSGLLGNGSSKWLSTGLAANFRNGRHIGFVPYTLGTTSFRYYMGVRNGGTPANGGLYTVHVGSPTTAIGGYCYSDAAGVGGADNGTPVTRRLVLLNNSSGAGGAAMYASGAATGTTGFGYDTALTANIAVFAVGQSAGTAVSHVNARLSGYTIGENMNATQAAAYSSIWTTLLTALGRV
jgi:hypothetical protein